MTGGAVLAIVVAIACLARLAVWLRNDAHAIHELSEKDRQILVDLEDAELLMAAAYDLWSDGLIGYRTLMAVREWGEQ